MQKLLASALAGATILVSVDASADDKKAPLPAPLNSASNFAFGGATTGTANLTGTFVPFFPAAAASVGLVVPGMQQQIGWAVESLAGDINSERDLFVVYAGTNDMLTAVFTAAPGTAPDFATAMPTAAGNIYGTLEAMSALGGDFFVVPNLPPLGSLPILINAVGGDPTALAGLTQASAIYNTQVLEPTLNAFRAAHPDSLVVSVDIFGATVAALSSGDFANTTGACYDAQTGQVPPAAADCDDICGDDFDYNYAFVDTVHPTERLYTYWAKKAAKQIKKALKGSDTAGADENLKGGFRRIVTLGDSFSDTGSFDNVWSTAIPSDFLPDVTYTMNRFSTGEGLIDMLEERLRVKFDSSAYIQ